MVKSDLLSLDFVVNRFFIKLFKTNNIDVVKTCQQQGFKVSRPGWSFSRRPQKKQRSPMPLRLFHCQNKTNKVVSRQIW